MNLIRRLSYSFLLLVVPTVWLWSAPRVWTDVQGRLVTGEFEGLRGELIVLRVGTKSYAFPLSRLSPPDQAYARSLAATLGGANISSPSSTSRISTNWPQWRGPRGDGVSRETGLLRQWSSKGPKKLWSTQNLGGGYSSVIVVDQRIYTLGDGGGATSIYALDRATGKLVWTTPIGGGGANGTPTFDPETEFVYAISKNGSLGCVRASNGELVWKKDFKRDFGGKMMSGWGYSESPLIDGPLLLCSPGAPDSAFAALDKRSGRTVWKAPFPSGMGSKGKDGAGYGSIAVVNLGGAKPWLTSRRFSYWEANLALQQDCQRHRQHPLRRGGW